MVAVLLNAKLVYVCLYKTHNALNKYYFDEMYFP